MVTGAKVYITPLGMKRMQAELRQLLNVERPKVVQDVTDAAAQGDRSENADYIYGKRRLREIDRRVRFLAKRIDDSEVIEPSGQRLDRVFFGALVRVEDEDGVETSLQIVGPDDETSPTKITYRSPIGHALLGKRVGDQVTVQVPKGERVFLVLSISHPPEASP